MAKCLVGAAGGGKVTVSGLSAAVVKQGTTVTVKQGAKNGHKRDRHAASKLRSVHRRSVWRYGQNAVCAL